MHARRIALNGRQEEFLAPCKLSSTASPTFCNEKALGGTVPFTKMAGPAVELLSAM